MMRKFFPLSWQSGVEQKDSAEECTDRDEVEIVHHYGGSKAAIVTEDIQAERKNSNPRKSKGSHSFKTKFQKFSHRHRPNKSKDEVKVSDSQQQETEEDNELKQLEDSVEIVKLSMQQKEILRTTWSTIYAELGQTLSYPVGGQHEMTGSEQKHDMSETFLRLFEEYPMSQQFFIDFRGTPIEALRNDARLSNALQEHAVRVLRVVEKVIGRLQDLEKSKNYLLKLGRFHRHAGIPSDYLGVMGSIFVLAVKPYLEKHEQWNEETEDAWMELFGHITRVMTHAHVHYIPRSRKISDNAEQQQNDIVQD